MLISMRKERHIVSVVAVTSVTGVWRAFVWCCFG